MKYLNYIFDLYGTLIDIHTDEEDQKLWQFMAKYLKDNFGVETTDTALHRDYLKICDAKEKALAVRNHSLHPEIKIEWVWEKLIGGPISDWQMRELCIAFREESRDKLVVYDGVKDTLTNIKDMGGKVFLLSNAQRLFTEKELADTGLTEFFDDIFISSDLEIKKPDGDFLRKLMAKHSLNPSESVMIGNEVLADVGVATEVGIDAIYLNTYNHSDEEIAADLDKCNAVINKVRLIPDGDITKILN
jgi:putative hydrolase of the HAD superfamily